MTDPRPADVPRAELDDAALRVLAFEREWAERVGNREAAIRAEFGFSSARYYQMLYALIDSPVALRHDPLLVHRLQRLRDARRRARIHPSTSARDFRPDSQDSSH